MAECTAWLRGGCNGPSQEECAARWCKQHMMILGIFRQKEPSIVCVGIISSHAWGHMSSGTLPLVLHVCSIKKRRVERKIQKQTTPFVMVHMDHLRPFPKSSKGNIHVLAVIDGFTKFAILRPVRSTNAWTTIQHLGDIFRLFGNPKILDSDQGSTFTCKKFEEFCERYTIRHVLNAVVTSRANGQVEHLNCTILGALLASNPEERK